MINASLALIDKLKKGNYLQKIKVELLNKDEVFIEDISQYVTDGSISVDKDRDIKRNLNLILDNPGNRFTPYPGGKIWLDKMIKVYIGIELPSGTEYVPQGVFNLSGFSASSGVGQSPQVKLDGLDKMSRWGKIVNTLTLQTGLNIGSAIQLVLDGIESKFLFEDCTDTIPYDLTYEPGTERYTIIKEIVDMITWDLGYNVYGELRFRPYTNPENGVVTWTYQPEDYTLYIGSEKSFDVDNLFNSILTIGASSTTATCSATAKDEDILSPFSIPNIGERLYIHNGGSPDSLINSVQLAQARSDYELRKKLQYVEKQNITIDNNFLHEEGDVIRLVDSKTQTDNNYELLRFTIPLKVDGNVQGECWRTRRLL